MAQDWGSGESILQRLERGGFCLAEIPRGSLLTQVCQWQGQLGVVRNEVVVKVCESREQLYIMHIPWFQPALDCGYFRQVHMEPCRGQDETQVFHCIHVELAILGISVESGFLELPEYFPHVVLVCL